MSFGERLRQLRTRLDLSQDDLSVQINQTFNTKINKFTISRLENEIQKPTVNLLRIFSEYFDVSLDYICGKGECGVDTEYDEIMAIRQEIRENPNMKILFSLSKKAPKSDVEEAIRLLGVLKKARDSEDA